MENQVYLFIIFILNGFLISILFDFFRILRKTFETMNLITYIEDIIFWVLTGISIIFCMYKFTNGHLRGFIFVGIGIGAIIYMLMFSKIFIKINLYIINFMKNIANYIFIKPLTILFNILKKIIFKPTTFLFINVKKFLSVFRINFKSLFLKKKKNESRKDFV